MTKFILFNLFFGLFNIIIVYLTTKNYQIKAVKPKKTLEIIKFFLNDFLIYLIMFLILSFPLLNLWFSFLILKEGVVILGKKIFN